MRELAADEFGFEHPLHLFFAPDGQHLHGWTPGRVLTWDAATGRVVRRRPFVAFPFHVALSPCGRWLAAAQDRHVELLDLTTGAVRHLPVDREATHLADVAFTPDGRHLLTVRMGDGPTSGLEARRVGSWRKLPGPKLVGAGGFDGHLAVSPDGRRVATVHGRGEDGVLAPLSLAVWGYPGGELLASRVVPACPDRVWLLADGAVLARYDWRRLVRHHPDTLAAVAEYRVPGRKRVELRTPTMHPDGRVGLIRSDGVVVLLDPLTLRLRREYDFGLADVGLKLAHGLAFDPDGLTAAAAGGGRVVAFDLD